MASATVSRPSRPSGADHGGAVRPYDPRSWRAVVDPAAFGAFAGSRPVALEQAWREHPHWVIANLAHAAYLPREQVIERLKALGAETVEVFERNGAQALLVHWSGVLVLAFRGTRLHQRESLPSRLAATVEKFLQGIAKQDIELPDTYIRLLANDVLADLKFTKAPLGPATVHRGFLREFDKLWRPCLLDVLEELHPRERPRVHVTGHSLGGAMATLAGTQWRFDSVVTFGEPRVGRDLGRVFQSRRRLRYVNGDDPVCQVPPSFWPFGFRHHGRSIRLTPPSGPDFRYDHSILDYVQRLAP